MKKICNISVIIAFIITLAVGGLSLFFTDDIKFSETENRYLSQKPTFTLKNMFSGKFMKDMEKYIDDQFLMRNQWISTKTSIQKAIGNREINGVYLGKDGYFIEKWTTAEFDLNQLESNIESLNSFTQNYEDKDIYVMIAPTAGLIMQDKLPKNAPIFNQSDAISKIDKGLENANFIDIRGKLFSHNNESLYYKTDHHWTSTGAFYAYEEWCRHKNMPIPLLSDYNISDVSTTFKGSLFSKVLDRSEVFDTIELFSKKDIPLYSVEYNFGKTNNNSVFSFDNLEKKDKYQFFLGGNYPELTISSDCKNGKRLLLLKDSYANAFIPFLVGDYEKIHVIDLRYFNQDLDLYIENCDVTEFLILYNIKNFSEDKTISRIEPYTK